jgi:hypothetical protein
MEIVLSLPDNIVEHIQSFSQVTKRDVATVLTDTLEMMWPAWGMLLSLNNYPPVETLSDTEVLALANSRMEPHQNERLGELQACGKAGWLTTSEQFELLVLMHSYQIGQLRKSEALAEAVRRGLQEPLPA